MTAGVPPSIENQYQEHLDDEYSEFIEWKEKKLRAKGLLEDGSPLGDSIHPDTIKSFNKLKIPVPDSVRLATLRPFERMKRIVSELKGKDKLDLKTVITRVYRLKDKATGKEFIVWDKTESIKDMNDNTRSANYAYCGQHQLVEGVVHRNAKHEITSSEITGFRTVLEKEFTKKNFEEVMKLHAKSESEEEPQYIIGFTKKKGKNSVVSTEDRRYSIKNTEDFVNGTWNELWTLGERALSSAEPSLSKLSQPVSEDPPSSLVKRMKGYISPDKISYTQTSYR